jgi:hypothetical protein
MYYIELTWNRESYFVPYGEARPILEDAISYAKKVENMGDGACVKSVRIVDNEGKVVWAYGKKVNPNKGEVK